MGNLETKIAVIGLGGVGGMIASMLASHGKQITVVARGERAAAIRKNGLVLHSDLKGEIQAMPAELVEDASELKDPELIFICVKNYSLEEVCTSLYPVVNEKTIIVPVMNGVDPGDRIRVMLPKCTVVDSLIYIIGYANADYSVTQEGQPLRIEIGKNHPTQKEAIAVKQVEKVMREADLNVHVTEDIICGIWQKYILNCAYNVATAAHDKTVGELRNDPQLSREYEALVWEAYNVGKRMGVALKPEHAEHVIWRFYHEYPDSATSSMHRDFRAKHPAELETFSGYIVKQAMRLGVDAPVSRMYYEICKHRLKQ